MRAISRRRLAVEQLQHLALEAAVAERGAGEMDEIDRPVVRRERGRVLGVDCAQGFQLHGRPRLSRAVVRPCCCGETGTGGGQGPVNGCGHVCPSGGQGSMQVVNAR